MQGLVVNVYPAFPGCECGFGALREFCNDHGPGDGGSAPCRQKRPVNGTHIVLAENVREESRNGGKASSIHRKDRDDRNLKRNPGTLSGESWDHQKQSDLHDEERDIGVPTTDI